MIQQPHGSCWSRLQAWSGLLMVLGGCALLLSWTDVSICIGCRHSLDSQFTSPWRLLSDRLGANSTARLGVAGALPLSHAAASTGDPGASKSGSNSSSSSSSRSSSHAAVSLPVLQVRLSGNGSDGGLLAAAATAGSMLGADSLVGAVGMAGMWGTAGAAANHTSRQNSSSSKGNQAASSSLASHSQTTKQQSESQAAVAPESAVAAVAKASTPTQPSKASVQTEAGLAQSISNSSSNSSSSSSSSSSSTASEPAACSCTVADPAALRKHCSVKERGWPQKNEELVTQCFDFLVNHTSEYLLQQHHDPAANIDCTKQLLLHTFWAGPMTWKLKAVIQSFLFTHYSNDTRCRPKPVLTVWLQTVDPTRDVLERWAKEWQAPYLVCSDQLQFRQLTPDGWLDWLPGSMLATLGKAGSNMTALRAAVRASAASGSRVSYSDAVRFLVLHAFGGIYTDGDVLLLRSLEPLGHFDFLYEWSFVKQGLNSAVFGAARGSPFTSAVIQRALQASAQFNASTGNVTFDARIFTSIFHPMAVLRRVTPDVAAGVQVLPSIPFDPIWLTLDTPSGKTHNITHIHKARAWREFFDKPPAHLVPPQDPALVFHGAFTHHWHNQWAAPLEKSSLIGQLIDTYEAFLQGRQPNLYGVRAEPCTFGPSQTR